MAQAVETKNVIQMGHLANLPAVAAAIPENSREVQVVGFVIGKATGLSYRNNPNGDAPTVGLSGIFEATPCDQSMPVIVGKTIFLPKGFMDTIIPALESTLTEAEKKLIPKKAPPKGKAIELQATDAIPLQLQIGVRRNNGAGVGYEFAVVMKRDELTKDDLLADLRKDFIPANLQAPATAEPKRLAGPAKGKAKKK